MALIPNIASSGIYTGYMDVAGLDESGVVDPKPAVGDFAKNWADSYNSYAKEGSVLGALNTGGNTGPIEAFFNSSLPNSSSSIIVFATALAEFWADVAIDAGMPAHGGSTVISVTNDALLHIPAFQQAILATLTSSESKPYFFSLIDNIQKIGVSAITWTVTELVGIAPASFSEKIA